MSDRDLKLMEKLIRAEKNLAKERENVHRASIKGYAVMTKNRGLILGMNSFLGGTGSLLTRMFGELRQSAKAMSIIGGHAIHKARGIQFRKPPPVPLNLGAWRQTLAPGSPEAMVYQGAGAPLGLVNRTRGAAGYLRQHPIPGFGMGGGEADLGKALGMKQPTQIFKAAKQMGKSVMGPMMNIAKMGMAAGGPMVAVMVLMEVLSNLLVVFQPVIDLFGVLIQQIGMGFMPIVQALMDVMTSPEVLGLVEELSNALFMVMEAIAPLIPPIILMVVRGFRPLLPLVEVFVVLLDAFIPILEALLPLLDPLGMILQMFAPEIKAFAYWLKAALSPLKAITSQIKEWINMATGGGSGGGGGGSSKPWYQFWGPEPTVWNSPTIIGVGDEPEPEWLMRESQLQKLIGSGGSKGQGQGQVINITINGIAPGADIDELAREIGRKLKLYTGW